MTYVNRKTTRNINKEMIFYVYREAVISTPTKKSYNQKPSRKRKQRKDESPSVQDIAQYHREF